MPGSIDNAFDPIILFDGHCVFCSSSMRFIHAHDRTGRLRFAALQSASGSALALSRDLESEDPGTFYVLLEGRTLGDADALRFVARNLRWPWRLFGLPAYLPRAIVVPLYRLIARNRYSIAGRDDRCFTPPATERHRFLV